MTGDLYRTKNGMVVDPKRFRRMGESFIFQPFNVERTRPLAKAIESDALDADEEVLAFAHQREVLVLSRKQMAYHHVAQGESGGKPWLVFF